MTKIKNICVRILCAILVFVLISEIPVSISYAAEEMNEFQMYVISEVEATPFVGDFLYTNGKVYVELWTLERLGEIETILLLDNPTYSYRLVRLGYLYDVPDADIIKTNDNLYIPFDEAANRLALFVSFDTDNRLLLVQQCADLSELEDLTYAIYSDNLYNIGYWKNSFWYEGGYEYAIALDALKNMNFLSHISGDAEMENYKEAIWKAILPSSEDEMLNFSKETNKTIAIISKYKKYADGWTKLLLGEDSGFMGDWGEVFSAFGKANDYMQTKEILDAIGHAHNLKNIDESYMSGIYTIIDENKGNADAIWHQAMNYIYTLYVTQESTWLIAIREAGLAAVDDMLNDIEDAVIEFFLHKQFMTAVKVTSVTLDLVFDTQSQVDATIKAHTCLELQGQCAKYKRKHLPAVSASWKNIDQDRLDRAYKFRNVLALYLRFGETAYKAIALDRDSELSAASAYSIRRINDALIQVMSYEENDFTFVKNNEAVIADLTDYANGLSKENSTVGPVTDVSESGTGTLEITWTVIQEDAGLSVEMTGMYGDETFIVYSGFGDEVTASDGTVLVTRDEMEGHYRYYINSACNIGTIDIQVATMDPMIINSALTDMDPQLYFTNADGVKTYSGESWQYKVRYPTGIWGMMVYMDVNGNFKAM